MTTKNADAPLTKNADAPQTKNIDALQGDGGAPLSSPRPGKPDQRHSFGSSTVIKSGPLFLSSKGIGWTSWKKRWFILTRTSLVFFRSDPSAAPPKGNEVNLIVGGIDLNNSGSVVVKADKKLLTVSFPDGRDGRSFTLKAETTEDLNEWKTALENALAQAPSADMIGQNGFKNDQTDSIDNSMNQLNDREPTKSKVVGRPILLALEDEDGAPSFLEKALRFVEEHGVKVEGILRQAADVELVQQRIREYEQGKVEFSAGEDAHVIADCVKYVLRELPSSPVPASCCKALLQACRTERAGRISAMRAAISETFPEPNRCLLQRILLMMQAVASHKAENRMSSSAVSACMAPLLLRALLYGDCEIESDFDLGGDNSLQLLQAAAAANHAQAIVITLLEEYDSLFGEGGVLPDMYTDSEESGTNSEEVTDVESYDDDDDDYDDEQDESVEESDSDEDDDPVSEASSETENSGANHMYDDKDHNPSSSKSSGESEDPKVNQVLSSNSQKKTSLPLHEDVRNSENLMSPTKTASVEPSNRPSEVCSDSFTDQSTVLHPTSRNASCIKKSISISNAPRRNSQHRTTFGRTSARKNVSMESIDFIPEDDVEIETPELQNHIAEEVQGNSNPEKQKQALQKRRLALEQEVASLQEQLQEEKNSRATLEAALKFSPGFVSDLTRIDDEMEADLEELALAEADLIKLEQKVNDLGIRLNLQHKGNSGSALNLCNKPQQISNQEAKLKNKLGTQSSSKKSGTKKEGGNPAMPKLSFKLNFMKDKGREFYQSFNPDKGKGSEFLLPLPSPQTNKNRVSEFLSGLNLEKGKQSELRQSQSTLNKHRGSESNPEKGEKGRGFGSFFQSQDKGSGKEGHSSQNSDKIRKIGSHSTSHSEGWDQHLQHSEKGKSEGHKPQTVEKGKSEGHKPQTVEKGKSEGQWPHTVEKGKSEGHKPQTVEKGNSESHKPQTVEKGKSEGHKSHTVEKGR